MFTESFIYFDWALKLIFDKPSALTASISTKAIPYVSQEAEVMGKKATELLLHKIDGKKGVALAVETHGGVEKKSEKECRHFHSTTTDDFKHTKNLF